MIDNSCKLIVLEFFANFVSSAVIYSRCSPFDTHRSLIRGSKDDTLEIKRVT